LWDQRTLAIVEAVGSPDPTRSHFDAQDYMESGTPGLKNAEGGWLNRALCAEANASPLRAISLTPDLPITLRGTNEAVAVESIANFQMRDAKMSGLFESLYGETNDRVLNATGRETFDAVKMMQSIAKTPYTASGGAQYPKGKLGQNLQQIARLIKANVGLEVAFTDVGGWDTHVQEMGVKASVGHLPNLLREFGDSLAAFSEDMGDRMEDIVIVTMSEFGRTAKENGNRGTDHGHANVMFVVGGRVQGGKVYGRWPGLEREQLWDGRDLALTTDFRTVLSDVVRAQMGNRQLSSVFPGFNFHQKNSTLVA
jgi:uncharacterized protein (DUF1501 family)